MAKVADMTVKQLKRRRRVAEVFSFLVSVLPVTVVVLMRWNIYTADPGGAIRLGVGGVILGVVLLLGILGRLKVPGDIWVLTFILVMAYLLRAILDDLILLSGMMLLGRLCDRLCLRTYIKRLRGEIEARRAAELAGKAVKEELKEYLEGLKK